MSTIWSACGATLPTSTSRAPPPQRYPDSPRSPLGDALRALLQELTDLLLPPRCAGCGGAVCGREILCVDCRHALPTIERDLCVRCQQHSQAPGALRCRSCAPDALAACLAEVWFDAATTGWVHRFKYPEKGLRGIDPSARTVVAGLAAAAAARAGSPPDLLVPIPLHLRAARRRGFNPAALLARAVARERKLPWDPTALARLRDTPSQTGLTRAARRRNVAGAFLAQRKLPERIWLVDDVVTTGSTLLAAARAARRAGAREVVAICAARTPAPTR